MYELHVFFLFPCYSNQPQKLICVVILMEKINYTEHKFLKLSYSPAAKVLICQFLFPAGKYVFYDRLSRFVWFILVLDVSKLLFPTAL